MTKTSNSKTEVLGIYAVKSPYHEKTYYLPFIIVSYAKSDNTYNVMTVEYKGLTSYKVDAYYPEKTIQELIASGVIIKKANPDDFRGNEEISDLISRYSNAKTQQS